MDEVDLAIVRGLLANGRATWAELGAVVGLTGAAVADRVRKLEQAGVITGYTAMVPAEATGADLTAFVAVTVADPADCQAFLEAVCKLDAVQECHHVAGEDSYLLKVRTRGTRGLERLITEELKRLPGVGRTRTTIVLSTAKETAAPPLPGAGGKP